MDNKLEQLTRKLYEEGLSKGQQESDRLVAQAREQARRIVAEAEERASEIISQARKQADELSHNTLSELTLAGRQMLATLKDRIADLVVMRTLAGPVREANLDPAFVKELLLTVACGWNAGRDDKVSLEALLPADQQERFTQEFAASVGALLDAGIDVKYSDRVKNGFRIGPRDGGYYLSFTDADFEALLGEYLREKVKHILYE